jgi:hypothetical protein
VENNTPDEQKPKVELYVDEDRILVRREGTSPWCRPVVDELGNFFFSLKTAAEQTDNHIHELRNGILANKRVRDRLFAWALENEVTKHVVVASRRAVKGEKGKKPLGPPRFAPEPAPAPAPRARPLVAGTVVLPGLDSQSPFLGVRWPDGSVTVRLSTKSPWSLTRPSMADVPTEIAVNTTWLRP